MSTATTSHSPTVCRGITGTGDGPPPPSDRDDEYTVSIIKYGTRSTRRQELFLNYHFYGEPDAPASMDYFFWVAHNRFRTIVIDTGFSSQAAHSRSRTMLVHPRDALACLGMTPNSVDAVILTHAHYDHVGNIDLFPTAPLLIAQREIDFWTGPLAAKPQFGTFIDARDIDALQRAQQQGRLRTHNGTATAAPGILVTELGGHTPGMSVVRVATNEGPVLLASDTMHLYEQFEREMPFSGVTDLAAMYEAYATIRAMLHRGVRHLVAGHDPETLTRFRASKALPELVATIGTTTADTPTPAHR